MLQTISFIALCFTLSAQEKPVGGSWKVVWDSDVSRKGATATDYVVKRRSTGNLKLEQKGDSLKGTWTEEIHPAGLKVIGYVQNGVVRFTTLPPSAGGSATERIEWNGKLDGGKLNGIMLVYMGSLAPAPRKWEAVR